MPEVQQPLNDIRKRLDEHRVSNLKTVVGLGFQHLVDLVTVGAKCLQRLELDYCPENHKQREV